VKTAAIAILSVCQPQAVQAGIVLKRLNWLNIKQSQWSSDHFIARM